MRLLKAQNTNLRNIKGKGVKYDINNEVVLDSTIAVLVPRGDESERPISADNGHVRYNTESKELEAYVDSSWRKVRYKEPNQLGITQQNLGNGDAVKNIFGPLNSNDPDYPVPAAAQNILVFIENVFQIAGTNYFLSQNPANGAGVETESSSLTTGTQYIIVSLNDGQGGASTDFTLVGASSNTVGTVFTATGSTAGTGTARETGYYLEFTSPPDAGKPITVLHNFDK